MTEEKNIKRVCSNIKSIRIKKRIKQIDLAEQTNDPKLFKILERDISDREAASKIVSDKIRRTSNQASCVLGQD
jgi:hypothetical protein